MARSIDLSLTDVLHGRTQVAERYLDDLDSALRRLVEFPSLLQDRPDGSPSWSRSWSTRPSFSTIGSPATAATMTRISSGYPPSGPATPSRCFVSPRRCGLSPTGRIGPEGG